MHPPQQSLRQMWPCLLFKDKMDVSDPCADFVAFVDGIKDRLAATPPDQSWQVALTIIRAERVSTAT
jgi:hypothetical protein